MTAQEVAQMAARAWTEYGQALDAEGVPEEHVRGLERKALALDRRADRLRRWEKGLGT